MELFALFFNLLFYIELSFEFLIMMVLKKENPKIESFPPSADLALDNAHTHTHTHTHTHIYIYIYIYIYDICWHFFFPKSFKLTNSLEI